MTHRRFRNSRPTYPAAATSATGRVGAGRGLSGPAKQKGGVAVVDIVLRDRIGPDQPGVAPPSDLGDLGIGLGLQLQRLGLLQLLVQFGRLDPGQQPSPGTLPWRWGRRNGQ